MKKHRYPQPKQRYVRYQRSAPLSFEPVPPTPLAAGEHEIPALVPIEPSATEELASSTRRRRWTMKRVLVIAVPVLLLTVAAAFLVPVLLAAHTAYSQIFVTPVPHLHVVLNAQGTPVIDDGTATTTPPAAAHAANSTASAATPVAVPTTDPADALPNWDGTGRVNILLLGSDTRGTDEVARSDTIILVTVNPETKQVSMLSIPRDLLVSIPNYGQDKINAAYAYGSTTSYTGPGLAVATVEYNFGIKIDYFAEVDTFGMASIIDTIGGVTLDVETPIKDDQYPGNGNNYLRVYFHTGLQHMNGTQAVQFARTRHDDDDFARGNRQQQLLRALQEQGVNLNLLSKARELLNELGNTFRTDLSPTQVLALAKLGSKITPGDIHSYDLMSATRVSFAPGQPYYLIPNWDAIHKIINEMMSQ